MSGCLKFFNFFSQSPALRINGDRRPASIFGSIIGIFTIVGLISAIIYILFNFFSRLDFTINSYTDNSAKPNIDLKNFKLSFFITDIYGNEFQDHEKIFEISAKFWEVNPFPADNDTQKIDFKNIPKIKCDRTFLPNQDEKIYYKSPYKNVTCFDLSKLNKNLTGPMGNLGR